MSAIKVDRFGFRPGEFGIKEGMPCIVWWRLGHASYGEPSIVTETRSYKSEAERYEAFVAP